MTASDTDHRATEARQRLYGFVERHGVDYTAGKVVQPLGPAGDCWTHAWQDATSTGRTYVEGVCLIRGQAHAHAWTVDDAGIVYEHTEGYERAGAYRGFAFDLSPGSETLRADAYLPAGARCSMLEGLLIHVPEWTVVMRFAAVRA